MGIQLVGQALNPHWAQHLTHAARVALIYMAHTAKDKDTDTVPAGEYWGGHAAITIAVTGDLPEPGTTAHKSSARRTRRLIEELTAAGAVERVDTASGRHRSRYRLTLTNFQPVDNVHPLRPPPTNSRTYRTLPGRTPGTLLFEE